MNNALDIVGNLLMVNGSVYIVYAIYTLTQQSGFASLYTKFVWAWFAVAFNHLFDLLSWIVPIGQMDPFLEFSSGVVITIAALSFRKNLQGLKERPTQEDQFKTGVVLHQQETDIADLKDQLFRQQLAIEDLFRTRLKKDGISRDLLTDLITAHDEVRDSWSYASECDHSTYHPLT